MNEDTTNKTISDLCRWWCVFNCWSWPRDFPTPPPNNFEQLYAGSDELVDIVRPIRLAIEKIVSLSTIMIYWEEVFLKEK